VDGLANASEDPASVFSPLPRTANFFLKYPIMLI
jgi:hypothetical protein